MTKQVKRTEQTTLSVKEILSKPYARVLVPESDGFRAEILEFPGCLAEGDSAAEAYEALEAVAESWIEATLESGLAIPEPSENYEFSGKLVLRLPKSMHKKASIAADRDGVSLNQFIVSSIAYQCGVRSETRQQAQVVVFNTMPSHHQATWLTVGMAAHTQPIQLISPHSEYEHAGN